MPTRKPLDWRGALVIGGAVATLVFGILEAPARGWTHPLVMISIGVGLLLSLAFGFVEVRQRYPLLDVRLFAVPAFATGAATITVFFLSMFGYMFLLMQYMQLILGYSPNKTALALSPIMGPMLVLSVLSFWYLPRLGLRAVVFSGLLLIAIGSICLLGIERGFALLASGLADVGDEHRHRSVHRADDVGHHDHRSRRQAGGGLGGQRCQPRNRRARSASRSPGRCWPRSIAKTLAPNLIGFPKSVGDAASTSLGQALEVARRLGPAGARLADVSKTAFIDAMHSSLLVLGVADRGQRRPDRTVGTWARRPAVTARARSCWSGDGLGRRPSASRPSSGRAGATQ